MAEPGIGLVGWVEALSPAIIAGFGAWIAVKIENAILKTRMSAVEAKLDEMGDVLVRLADFKGQLALIEQRMVMQGGRVDDMTKSLREILMERRYGSKTRSSTDS